MSGRLQILFLQALLLVIAISAVGCSGGGNNTLNPAPSKLPATTTTLLSLSASSVNVGDAVALAATVTAGGNPVTSGSVTFYDGATVLATQTLNSSGSGQWSGASFAIGTHNLTASYGGSSGFAASSSVAASLIVAGLRSTVALSASTLAATQGLPIEFVAVVQPASTAGSQTPTGTVTLATGGNTLGTAALDPTGVANFTSTMQPIGNNSISATYNGDSTFAASGSSSVSVSISAATAKTYTNPLTLNVSGSQQAVSCADPSIYKDQNGGVDTWYLYCTSDALYGGDTRPHFINVFHSSDLVNWTYDGDAFSGLPSWASIANASLWAPAIKFFNGKFYLYYAASVTSLAGNGSAIGVGTSGNPAGPFTDTGVPVVEPELATNCCAGSYRTTIDPDEIEDASGQRYILFGGFGGGLYVRKLSADGLTSDKTSEQLVAADNRYEGGNWWFHDGYFYLLASATNCCNGPLSGYSVFVGRSATPMGPYLDAQGISMTAVNPGGTPVLAMNGNQVLGPGGNVLFTDEAGQDYILYHGIVAGSPYYAGSVGYTARPAFIDAIDWSNGWPVARGGYGPSDTSAPQPVPASQPGDTGNYKTTLATSDVARTQIAGLSDDFSSTTLGKQWSVVHLTANYSLMGNSLQIASVAADPVGSMAAVPLIAEPAPPGEYMVETKIDINLPIKGVGTNYAQAGLLIYGDDENFVRADVLNNNDTRQVEFVKAETPLQAGYPTWGVTDLGPAQINSQATAWVRIVKRNLNGTAQYKAYSSNDGMTWIEGGTWIHSLGSSEKICLYAGNQAGFTGTFHYVHVFTVQ